MFETIVAFVLCAAALGMAGTICWLTWKGYDKKVRSLQQGPVVEPTVKRKHRATKKKGRR